jgi:protein-S-isoprenylcysteine O-methyltransferase Ste14
VGKIWQGIGGAVAGAAYAALVVVYPFVGIRSAVPGAYAWQELTAFGLAIATGALMGSCLSTRPAEADEFIRDLYGSSEPDEQAPQPVTFFRIKQRLKRFLAPRMPVIAGQFYVYLYCCAIALCQRLHLWLWTGGIAEPLVRTLGLLILLFGASLLILGALSVASWGEPRQALVAKFVEAMDVRYPALLGWLVVLIGMPLAFASPMPLAGVPGAFIGLSWRLDQLEIRFRDKYRERYERLLKRKWRIVPFLR